MFSEHDVSPLQHINEKCTWEKRGKDHFSWSTLLLAESQGQAAKVLLFTFLTWGWGRKGGRGEGGGLRGACVSRSAWDSLARRWEEHVVLILSMGGLERSIWHWHAAAKGGKTGKCSRWKHFGSFPAAPLIYSTSFSLQKRLRVNVQVNTSAHVPTFHMSQGWGGLKWLNQYSVNEKVSKLRKRCLSLDFSCSPSPITSGDTPPHGENKHCCTNMQAHTSLLYTHTQIQGDFHGNVICIISTSMV